MEAEKKSEKRTQVLEQTDILDQEISMLHTQLGILIGRLDCVVRPIEARVDKKEKAEELELVLLARCVRDFALSVKQARIRVEATIEGLEL